MHRQLAKCSASETLGSNLLPAICPSPSCSRRLCCIIRLRFVSPVAEALPTSCLFWAPLVDTDSEEEARAIGCVCLGFVLRQTPRPNRSGGRLPGPPWPIAARQAASDPLKKAAVVSVAGRGDPMRDAGVADDGGFGITTTLDFADQCSASIANAPTSALHPSRPN